MLVAPNIAATSNAWAKPIQHNQVFSSLSTEQQVIHHCEDSVSSGMFYQDSAPSISEDCCTLDFHFCCSPLLAIQTESILFEPSEHLAMVFPELVLGFAQTGPQSHYRPPLV